MLPTIVWACLYGTPTWVLPSRTDLNQVVGIHRIIKGRIFCIIAVDVGSMRSDTSVFECDGVEVIRAVLDITIEDAVDNGQIDSCIRPSQQTTDFSFGM